MNELLPCGLARVLGPRRLESLLRHIRLEEIPDSTEILSGTDVASILDGRAEPRFSVLAAGDVMLGGRARPLVAEHGADYPFDGVRPLLQHADVVIGNLEGPLARHAPKVDRTYSYRVDPRLAASLARAGINVVTLANNHLMDCGREGVVETLQALACAGVTPVGAGVNREAAHDAAILQAGPLRIGLLGYYWNRRCAATEDAPGGAMDPPEALRDDIGGLRGRVDRVVVAFHWGVPYERETSPEDRAKARFAVDCGADAVIGHHPHVVQPMEVHRGCPIFYSVGNFAFGSGNSRGEGLLVGLRFEEIRTVVEVYPLYVKNRDPRVAYQPKLLRGSAAGRVLGGLVAPSGPHGAALRVEDDRGVMEIPRTRADGPDSEAARA
jgi:hypothetical protein